MTLKDFIMEGLIKDDDKILILNPICGTVYNVRGNWFQDHILNLQDRDVMEVSWNKEKGWKVLLAEVEVQDVPFR